MPRNLSGPSPSGRKGFSARLDELSGLQWGGVVAALLALVLVLAALVVGVIPVGGTARTVARPSTSVSSTSAAPAPTNASAEPTLIQPSASSSATAAQITCPTTASPIPATAVLGIAAGSGIPQLPKAEMHSAFERYAAGTVCPVVRADIEWRNIQRSPGKSAINWDTYGTMLEVISEINADQPAEHKIFLIAPVGYAPGFSSLSGDTCNSGANLCAPDAANGPDYYGQFMAAVLGKLAELDIPSVREAGNEMNQFSRFRFQASKQFASPAELYAAMLKAVAKYTPGQPVVFGGLAQIPTNEGGTSALDFVQAVCAAGAHGASDGSAEFTAMGLHVYPDWAEVQAIHTWMTDNGCGTVDVLATEVGPGGDAPNGPALESILTRGLELPFVKAIVVYSPYGDGDHTGIWDHKNQADPGMLEAYRKGLTGTKQLEGAGPA